jgi:hypothetical protein
MPVIKWFDWTLPVVIKADFSQEHVGGALLQPYMRNGRRVLHSVGYFSRKLTDTQTRYLA